jgi:quercetin 2,3-dioxygenase
VFFMTQTTALSTPRTSSVPSPSVHRIKVLRLAELMLEDRGWTRGHATLSFDDVPKTAPGYLEFGALCLAVLQEIDPGSGYPMHPHQELETIMILLEGSLAHADNLGSSQITGPNDVTVLSAGTGIEHAEMVHGEEKARAVMFALRPSRRGAPPEFTRRTFDRAERKNRWAILASGGGDPGALPIRHDATVRAAILDPGVAVEHRLSPNRRVYLLATDAPIEVRTDAGDAPILAGAGERILCEVAGDGGGAPTLRICARGATEVVLLDFVG